MIAGKDILIGCNHLRESSRIHHRIKLFSPSRAFTDERLCLDLFSASMQLQSANILTYSTGSHVKWMRISPRGGKTPLHALLPHSRAHGLALVDARLVAGGRTSWRWWTQ